MKIDSIRKMTLAGLGTMLALTVLAGPAQADPTTPRTLHGSGSATTQDVMQGIAENSGGLLASWNASGSEFIIVKGVRVKRPNGSVEGRDALRRSLGRDVDTSSWDQGESVPLGQDTFDWARSSIGPGSDQDDAGQLVYVPFALDAVTTATGPSSTINADDFTFGQLQTLYRDGLPVTAGGVTYQPRPDVAGHNITLLIPQPGSETCQVWANLMGFDLVGPPLWVVDEIGGTPNQENDGSLLAANSNAITPFSIPQWIAQGNGIPGVVDRRANADIHAIDGEEPYNVVAGEEVLNVDFNVTRVVYNIVDHAEVTGGDLDIQEAFDGPTSKACITLIGDRNAIEVYGFGLLEEGVPTTLRCGDVLDDLRAFPNG